MCVQKNQDFELGIHRYFNFGVLMKTLFKTREKQYQGGLAYLLNSHSFDFIALELYFMKLCNKFLFFERI